MSDTDRPLPHVVYVDSTGEHVFVPQTVDPPDPPDPPAGTEASVTIHFGNGLSVTLDPTQGTPLDSYTDPQGAFVMGNVLCEDPDMPGFRAYYRADEAGGREEWVFEYGDPWLAPPTQSLAPYTVDITCANGDTVCVEADVGQYWFTRWRWQSAPRPVRSDHATLAALNLIPHIDSTGLNPLPVQTVAPYTPMAYCGIPKNQTQTGGYPGLGIMTGWQAQYLTRGAPESSFRNQAEASGSFQAHVRDTNTHAPIDILDDYPDATMYSAKEGDPFIPRSPAVNITDPGHMPSLTYIPFLLTGDPYYLEQNQFWANQNLLSQPSDARFMVAGRYLAWPLREIYETVLITPDTVPSWLLPKSYWTRWLDTCRGFVTDRMANNSDPWMYVFHTIPSYGPTEDLNPPKSGERVWQQNMLDLVAAWIASTNDQWRDPAEWLMHNSVARASATSGWCRSHPSPYTQRLRSASELNSALDASQDILFLLYTQTSFRPGLTITIDNEEMTLLASHDGLDWSVTRHAPVNHAAGAFVYGPKCLTWCEAAELTRTTYGWTDTEDNDHFGASITDLTYPSYQRAALAQGLRAGLEVPGLSEAYEWLDGEMRRFVQANASKKTGDNWNVSPNLAGKSRRVRRHASDRHDPAKNDALWDLLQEREALAVDSIETLIDD